MPPEKDVPTVPRSYLEHFRKYNIIGDPIDRGQFRNPEPGSLLVHTLTPQSLERVAISGSVGVAGMGPCAMSQDRMVYDDGYAIVFQADDLVAAGYPLLQVNEDFRDAKVLREWRTPMAIDVGLARLIVPTADVPGHELGQQAQIASRFFGEEYLRKLPRL